MIATIKIIAKDLARGKNIVNYLLVVAAIILPAARIFKIAPVSSDAILMTTTTLLGVLLAKAISNGWRLENLEPRLLEDYVQVVPTWSTGQISESLSRARHSVVMVQSWFPDAVTIADFISDASASLQGTHALRLEIFMLDPESAFGAQRYSEVYGCSSDSVDPAEKFRAEFERAKEVFVRRLGEKPRVEMTVLAYRTLPTLKAYVVDSEDYFFGWLGADGPSTRNIGFHMSSGSDLAEVRLATERIDRHLEQLRLPANSRVVWPLENSGH